MMKSNDIDKPSLNFCRILQTVLERVSADGDDTYTLTVTVSVSPQGDGQFTIIFTVYEDGKSTAINQSQDFDMNAGTVTSCDVEISGISLNTFSAGKAYTVITNTFFDGGSDATAAADINTTVYANPQSSYRKGFIDFSHDKIDSGEKYVIKPKSGIVIEYTDIYSSGIRFGRGFSIEVPQDDDAYELVCTPYNIKKQSETSYAPKEQISLAGSLTTEVITASPEITGITKPAAGKIRVTFKLPDFYALPTENFKSLIAFGQRDEIFNDYSGMTACTIVTSPAKTDDDTLYYSEIDMPELPEAFGGNYLFLFIKTQVAATSFTGTFIYAYSSTKNTVCIEEIIAKTDWTFSDAKANLTAILSYNCQEAHTFDFDKIVSVDDIYSFLESGEKLKVTPKFKDKSGFAISCDGFERGYYPYLGTLIHLNSSAEINGNTVYTFNNTDKWYKDISADITVQIAGKVTVAYAKATKTTTVTVVNKTDTPAEEGENPAAIKTAEFVTFLNDLTNGKITPLGFYKLREIVSRSAAFDFNTDGDFIALGLDKGRIQIADQGYCTADLLPGFILGVQTADMVFQSYPTENLFQGFTPSFKSEYYITAESDDSGMVTLVLDKNLRKTVQLWGAGNTDKTVLGGDIDFFKSELLKSYAKITAPKSVLESNVFTSAKLSTLNYMCIIFSDDYGELLSNLTIDTAAQGVLTFRVRAAVTTNLRVNFCGEPLTVPAGTTLSDIAHSYGISQSGLNTLRFYRRDAQGFLCRVYADLTQCANIQLLPGDVIKYE
ncbi:MAG: hypothetical protein LBM87_00260 [Ruminococcus sp.]|jgi:hypothetical protein|nr:hypothetical protein [Ruminococcus sp.]